ncbi:alpha/beta fold hydrolase [Actinospongicola halichondriae]|uniref:alpha/beta fold hydrolase n=1 Tax=Actinospongicola halichondriae TaxID=3236844 RepID=UPI003D4F325F
MTLASPPIDGVTSRTVHTNGVDLHVLDAGPADGPVVVLAHGFPELAYSWRHQIPALAAAGYRVLAPDQRGYGRSSRPDEVTDYDIVHLTDDLCGLLDDVGATDATFVGHDWGSMVVWQMALLHPDRVNGVVGMSVPFLPRAPMAPVQMMRHVFADNFFYIVYFQEPGVADAELGADPATTMRRLLCGVAITEGDDAGEQAITMAANDGKGFIERMPEPDGLPDWLTQDELDFYVAEFTRTGFTGGINWYRNMDRNWELTPQVQDQHVIVPSAFIGGSADPVLVMSPPDGQEAWLDDFRGSTVVPGAGHWVQQDSPGPVNDALLDFLEGIQR